MAIALRWYGRLESLELRSGQEWVLADDPELESVASDGPGATKPASPGEPTHGRRPATVVFADIVESTSLGELLDAESLHRMLARYFEMAREVLERHGGATEKFIGDAVVGFFGL